MALSPAFASIPNVSAVTLLPADGTNRVTIFTAGTSGAKVTDISVASTDTVAPVLVLFITVGGVDRPIARVPMTAASVGAPLIIAGIASEYYVIWLAPGTIGLPPIGANQVLKVRVETAITATRQIDIVVFGGDF